MSYLQGVAKGNIPFMVDMLHIFLSRTPETLSQIEKALESEDWTEVGFYAHKLKATYAYVGMENLRQLTLEIEKAAKSGENMQLIPAKFEYLYKSTLPALEELLQYKIELEQSI
jgi:HPt (histidine-containing phosphotransfer) domain-containing protein